MDSETQKKLDTVPDHLKSAFGLRLKQQFDLYNTMCAELEADPALETDPAMVGRRDDFLQGMEALSTEFEAAGGTEEQWNILAPAIHYGDLSP
jgi:hypothetical protein